MTKKKAAKLPSSRPIIKALDQNDNVKKVVKQSADELLIVNAVLKKGIPAPEQKGDLAQALEKTEHIEDTIQESAEDLAEVNKLLEHEVDERIVLERELQNAKKALARAKGNTKKA